MEPGQQTPPAEERHRAGSVCSEGEERAAEGPQEGSAGGLCSGSTDPRRHCHPLLPAPGSRAGAMCSLCRAPLSGDLLSSRTNLMSEG